MSFDTLRNVYQARMMNETPNEIADKLHLNQKTVQGALLELANTKKDVRWKKVGRLGHSGRPNKII